MSGDARHDVIWDVLREHYWSQRSLGCACGWRRAHDRRNGGHALHLADVVVAALDGGAA